MVHKNTGEMWAWQRANFGVKCKGNQVNQVLITLLNPNLTSPTYQLLILVTRILSGTTPASPHAQILPNAHNNMTVKQNSPLQPGLRCALAIHSAVIDCYIK